MDSLIDRLNQILTLNVSLHYLLFHEKIFVLWAEIRNDSNTIQCLVLS
jgi:hypothetical protein